MWLPVLSLAVLFAALLGSLLFGTDRFNLISASAPADTSESPQSAQCSDWLSARLSQFARLATHVQSFPPRRDFTARWQAADDLRALLRVPQASTADSFEAWFNALLRVATDAMPSECRAVPIPAVRPLAPQAWYARQFTYAALLRDRFVRVRNDSLRAHDGVQRSAVVVGAGPLGLASALEAYRRGSAVHVIEKRLNYTRNIWFDLYSKPWSAAGDWLRDVGGDVVLVETERHNGTTTTTIRAQFLERLMSMAAYSLGVDVAYGRIAVGLCRDAVGTAFVAAIDDAALTQPLPDNFSLCAAEPYAAALSASLPFDVVVAADGAESDTRRLAHMAVMRQEQFMIAAESVEVPHLHQTTTVVDFYAVNGSCPELLKDEKGNVLDPRYPSMVLKTVSNVFKRFYHRHCHLQIMWTLETGEQIMRVARVDNGSLPWSEILDVVGVLFAKPPANVAELQLAVERVNVFTVVIDAATKNTLLWDAAPKHKPAIVALVGDALVTAHYRLGIGINQGLTSIDELGELLHSLSLGSELTPAKAAEQVRMKQLITEKRVHSMLQFMLTVMFLETYCDDLLVFFDASTDNLWSTVSVYEKRLDTKPINYMASGPLATADLKKKCATHWRNTIVET